jgi:hypothetical protein
MCAAEEGVNGTPPDTVRVRKEYSGSECDEVEGRVERPTPQSLRVVISSENDCSSSKR